MKKFFVLLSLVIPLYARGQNVVFNPGFDMVPWDTGWTIEIDTGTISRAPLCSVAIKASADSGKGRNSCYSCSLYADCGGYSLGGFNGGFHAYSKVTVTQTFDTITGTEVKAWVKIWICTTDFRGYDTLMVSIQVLVNSDKWLTVWDTAMINPYPIQQFTWKEICLSVDSTISGIRFTSFVNYQLWSFQGGAGGASLFWIDDIWVGKAGIEERELRVESKELRVLPNPFIRSTNIRFEDDRLEDCKIRVYDMGGQLVEETKVGFEDYRFKDCKIGENLPTGVYFVKVAGYKPVKIIKIGGVK